MAMDLERLVVQLSADIKKYENALSRAQGQTTRRFTAIQRQATTSSKAIAASLARTGAQIAAAFVFSSAIRNLASLSDAATRIDNTLKVVGVTGRELERVYTALATSAMANGAPIESLATLYSRASLAQKELGVTTEELLKFTDNIAVALRVAGTDAQTASGALLQLGQALGSGRVMAEEFNSILEGTPTIARAVAAGLKEAGGSVSQLKALVVDGKVSSEAFFRAFEAGSVVLEGQASKATFTISQATTNLTSALINVVREFNNSTGASERFAGGINSAADAISNFDVSGLIEKIREINKQFEDYLSNVEVFEKLNQLTGTTDAEGNAINIDKTNAENEIKALEKELETLQTRISLNTDLGFDNTEAMQRIAEVTASLAKLRATADALPDTVPGYQVGENGIEAIPSTSQTNGQMGGSQGRGGARRRVVTPVSIKDFAPPTGSKSNTGSVKQTADSRFADDVQAIRDRTAALIEEQSVVGLSYREQEKRRLALDLEQTALADLREEARKKGQTDLENIQLSASQRATIEEVSSAYAKQADILRQVEEAQQNAQSAAQEFYDTAKSGFADVVLGAESLGDALKNLGNKLAELLVNSAFDNIFGGGPGKSGGTDILTSLFKGLGFRENGGPVSKGKPYIVGEKRAELFVPSQSGTIVPRIPTAPLMPDLSNMAASRSSGPSVTFAPVIDARGADVAAVARLEAGLQRTNRELAANVLKVMKQVPIRGVKI